jgi:hypothetical protein
VINKVRNHPLTVHQLSNIPFASKRGVTADKHPQKTIIRALLNVVQRAGLGPAGSRFHRRAHRARLDI